MKWRNWPLTCQDVGVLCLDQTTSGATDMLQNHGALLAVMKSWLSNDLETSFGLRPSAPRMDKSCRCSGSYRDNTLTVPRYKPTGHHAGVGDNRDG